MTYAQRFHPILRCAYVTLCDQVTDQEIGYAQGYTQRARQVPLAELGGDFNFLEQSQLTVRCAFQIAWPPAVLVHDSFPELAAT